MSTKKILFTLLALAIVIHVLYCHVYNKGERVDEQHDLTTEESTQISKDILVVEEPARMLE